MQPASCATHTQTTTPVVFGIEDYTDNMVNEVQPDGI